MDPIQEALESAGVETRDSADGWLAIQISEANDLGPILADVIRACDDAGDDATLAIENMRFQFNGPGQGWLVYFHGITRECDR